MRKTLTSAGALCGAVLCGGGLCAGALAAELPDIGSVLPDLTVPTLEHSQPGPGKRVYEQESEYAGTDVRHIVYLPRDWRRDKLYPVIVEYAGNGPYENKDGDVSTGEVEGSVMGYGLSGGEGFIWLALPFVNSQEKKNQAWWWGDVEATVDYAKRAVRRVCKRYAAKTRESASSG